MGRGERPQALAQPDCGLRVSVRAIGAQGVLRPLDDATLAPELCADLDASRREHSGGLRPA